MQKLMIAAVVAFAALEMCPCLIVEPQAKYFNANPRALDYKFIGKNDEHRYGVELKENRQFHHTKSAEDGVRLGCYGHELEGKKYSTHYVADSKGYRLVPHQGLITVYPKDGGKPRQASFVQSFNEDEVRSSNIRYFFPDGCSSAHLIYDSTVVIPKILKKDEVIEVPVEETTTVFPEETTTEQQTEEPKKEEQEEENEEVLLADPIPAIYHIVPPPISIRLEIILPTNIFSLSPFQGPLYLPEGEKCSATCCTDKSASKFVIPIEKMSVADLVDITNETNNVKMVAKLMKFVEKVDKSKI